MTQSLTERYRDRLARVLSCYDRIVITGTLPGASYAGGMTSFLYSRGIRIFDYAPFAEPLRERIRARAQEACAEAGIEIEHINKPPHSQGRGGGESACAPGGNIRDWCT